MLYIQRECLDRLILFGERSLRGGLAGYVDGHHEERNHQGPGNRLIDPADEVGHAAGDVQYRERLGGMLRYYYRQAA